MVMGGEYLAKEELFKVIQRHGINTGMMQVGKLAVSKIA